MQPTGSIRPEDLKRAQDVVKGRGFFGWLMRLFAGKQMRAGLDRSAAMLDQIELRQRLATTGKSARAVVQAIQDTGSLVNFDPVVVLTLRVQPDGQPEFQAVFTTPVSKIAVPRVGDNVDVRYDPQDPSRIALA